MARAILTVEYDDTLVSARYMAEHLTETVEGITSVDVQELD